MKSAVIKKTTSYIMGIPVNDADINTPQLVYDRINASDEFELKNISFDDRNICPMVTVGYKDEEYIVDIKIEPVSAIAPDFMFCHPMPDECIKRLKKAQIGVTVSITFGKDNSSSYHFQLKLLDCILPDTVAVVDFNTKRIFAPAWLKAAAKSSVSPGPSYIFSINVVPDKDDTCWIYSQGINRCGFVELEALHVAKENSDSIASIISIAATKAITEDYMPAEMEPFEIASVSGGDKLRVTWRYWKGEVALYPDGTLGTGNMRPKEQSMFNGMLFIYPLSGKSKKPVRANEASGIDMNEVLVEYTQSETKRTETLAAETFSTLAKGLTLPEAKALVKIRLRASENKESLSYEHIWAEVDELGTDEIYCVAVNDSIYSNEIKKGEKFQTSIKNITDWILNVRGKRIVPDNAFIINN